MSGKSSKTTPVHFRLPNEVYEIIARRVKKSHDTMSDYLRKRIVYDTMRSHKRHDK